MGAPHAVRDVHDASSRWRDVALRKRILYGVVALHAAGGAFSMLGFLFFPEVVVDLVPDQVPLSDVRHMLAVFAVLPATFVAWDTLLLMGLRAGIRDSLVIGFVVGGAGILGAFLHLVFAEWPFVAADGLMGLLYVAVTWWNWRTWPQPPPTPSRPVL